MNPVKKLLAASILLLTAFSSPAQQPMASKPKIVIGMMVEYLAKGWETLYPIESYVQSDADNKDYEKSYGHEKAPVFPHTFSGREKQM